MSDSERGTTGPGLLVRQAWLAAAVPLLAMVALTLPNRAQEVWVYQAGVLWLPPAIRQLQVGFDRAGDHVAVLDDSNAVHLLNLANGQLSAGSIPAAWPVAEDHRLRLTFSDLTGDQLVDLGVVRFPRGGPGRIEGFSQTPWPTAVYRQSEGAFAYQGTEDRLVALGGQSMDSLVVTGSGTFRLNAVQSVNSPLPRTHLVSVSSERVAEVLEGEPYFVGDIDDDGNHDLLTVEFADHVSPLSRYRLFLYRDGGFRQVWAGSFQQQDDWRRMRRHTAIADLDHDRGAELIMAEPSLGKITVWRLDPRRIGGH